MNFYWLYSFSNFGMFLLITSFFVGFGTLGQLGFRKILARVFKLSKADNEAVNVMLMLVGAFYGITLGLIAVASQATFSNAEDKVSTEAASLTAMYRSAAMLESPDRERMKGLLRDYVEKVINESWPQQQRGEVPTGGTSTMNELQNALASYRPQSERDTLFFAQTLSQFSQLIEARRERLNRVTAGLPAAVWSIVIGGALFTIALSWFLTVDRRSVEFALSATLGVLLGGLIFLIAAMDNPFLGEFSVTPQPFLELRDGLMKTL
jgi:uncharacterized integral membrane protein